MGKLNGGCYCGAIRYQITSLPTWAAHCHCRSCQMALGGAFLTWAKVAAGDFEVTKGKIKTIQSNQGKGFVRQENFEKFKEDYPDIDIHK